MRVIALFLAVTLSSCAAAEHDTPPVQLVQEQGRFVEEGPFAVSWLPDQQLTIWLPPGYDTSDRRYPVLYIHDGHNLFDPAKSNFDKVWAADKAMLSLIEQGRVEPHIIVGIWAPGAARYRQYLPAFIPDAAPPALVQAMDQWAGDGRYMSRRYLRWLADELKPRIDTEYRTLTGPEHTAIAGSSMGGIMSCWAISERPDIYGRAACLSSHWPIADGDAAAAIQPQVATIWTEYFDAYLGEPNGRRIWMDHGTATLDRFYAPYQRAVENSFREAGWVEGTDFRTEVYEGAEHEENAWAERLPEVLGWLLSGE